jgi:TolB-like protein
MSNKPSGLSRFWKEVKRRKVLRSLAIYAGTAFVILEAATIIFPRWGLPEWSIDLVLWLLILGLFINLIIAWMFDITSDGLQKTRPAEELQTEEKPADSRGWKAATFISVVVIVALVVFNVLGPVKSLRAGDIQSLLVLPFDNFTGDDQLDYVAAGMHSSLIGDMGQISGLRIISKTTANIYKKMELDLPQMAAQLNADAVVEPMVTCYGDSVCIQIRMVLPFPEEKQIWMGEYREEKGQILNLYNKVCKQIADEIRVTLTPHEEEVLTELRSVNTDAYDAYMKGQYYWDQLTPDALQTALQYFNKAIKIDPEWAPPYAGVAAFWIGVRQMGLAPSSITVPNIYKFLNKSIELDPNSALTHFTTAVTAVWTGYDWEKGERDFLKVIELTPNNADNRAYYAHLLMFLKRHDEALAQARLALDLDPLNPLIQGLVAVVHWHNKNYDQAKELANQIAQLVPNHPLAIGVLWGANELQGNYEEAIAYCLKLFMLDEESSAMVMDTYKEQGYASALGKVITILESMPEEQVPVSLGIRIANMYLKIDKNDEALNILEDLLEKQGPDLPYVFTGSEIFEEIQDHPRFLAIQEKMGLPPMPNQ